MLSGLVLLAGFGWYHNTFESNNFTSPQKKYNVEIAGASTKSAISAKKESTINIGNIIAKPPVPDNLVSNSAAANLTGPKKLPSPVPYKHDMQLPPPAKFAVNNAANRIFAKAPTAIYAKPDSRSKLIAQVKAGQEMRSYDKSAGWHRVVVPSTAIIGWANEKDLSEKTPNIANRIDHSLTGAIVP
ncbi:hypothetical protein [uncultured Bartonella sp.]|uniref:hypothetical protein n=1 Tax=uncultured Bartonella sp. TaxID=104108 RepID=UPI00260A49A5|nr:hypothetical protein [uncultured Bartonella sp.]